MRCLMEIDEIEIDQNKKSKIKFFDLLFRLKKAFNQLGYSN
jgi:hypothetical protein